ncbi:MAG TPA: hypothetical protein VMG12_39425 [Polyangiaceae bacterium]|nr:hypothetical protein [Polyangiaceae bacterium]
MTRSVRSSLAPLTALAALCTLSSRADAQPPPGLDTASAPPSAEAVPIAPIAAPPKAPYSLPFQLRPAQAVSVVRTDTSFAFYDDPTSNAAGTTIASTLLASYKVTDNISPLVRVGMVSNSPPVVDGAAGFLNPVLGVTYGMTLSPELRLALFFGTALPLGSGGGDTPDPAKAASNAAGIRARSAMDNAMFAVNDLVLFPGASLAYVAGGFTVQIEATVLELLRVRGEDAVNAMGNPINPDSSRTNFTGGVHVGYFIFPELSAAVELRHQRWLSTPAAIENDTTDTLRDTTTVAVGPRLHFKVGDKSWIRPALAFAFGLDDPLQRWESRSVQLDIPFIF